MADPAAAQAQFRRNRQIRLTREQQEQAKGLRRAIRRAGGPELPDVPAGEAKYYRWSRKPDDHVTGILGSAGRIDRSENGEFFVPYINPTFGEDTVYAAATPAGSRGFLQEEMLRNFLNKEERPTESERWHLYTISLPVRNDHQVIDLTKFGSLPLIQTPEEWRGARRDHLRRPDGEKKDLMELLQQVPPMRRRDMEAFRKYMLTGENTTNPLGGRGFIERDGAFGRQRYQIHPYHRLAVPPPAMLAADPANLGEVDRETVRRFLIEQQSRQREQLRIAQHNARLTHEVQMKGPIDAFNVTKIGSVEFTPELWDDHAAERKARPNPNKQRFPPWVTRAIREEIDTAEAQLEDDIFA